MIEDRFKMSGELFKKILSHMDSLTRTELLELQAESRRVLEGDCSQAPYYVVRAVVVSKVLGRGEFEILAEIIFAIAL